MMGRTVFQAADGFAHPMTKTKRGTSMNKASLHCMAYAFLILPEDDPYIQRVDTLFQKYGRKMSYVWVCRMERLGGHYLGTGVLGSYETAGIIDRNLDGKPVSLFSDTELKSGMDGSYLERRMMVGGKRFVVHSVFPKDAAMTPTDKMLELIDAQMKKEAHSS